MRFRAAGLWGKSSVAGQFFIAIFYRIAGVNLFIFPAEPACFFNKKEKGKYAEIMCI